MLQYNGKKDNFFGCENAENSVCENVALKDRRMEIVCATL